MKPRAIYYRKKGKGIAIEGKSKGRSILIWSLPLSPEKFFVELEKASFFKKEKLSKIKEKIGRLDFKKQKLKC